LQVHDAPQPILLISKSEKEIEIISKNRDALLKREQYILKQAVDVEASFRSQEEPARLSSKPNNFQAKFGRDTPSPRALCNSTLRTREMEINERES
jgi:hypothetical protein